MLTAEAYAQLDALRARMRERHPSVIAEHDLPWHVVTRRRQGLRRPSCRARCATTATSSTSTTVGQAHWLVQHNGGVFLPPWGKVEQWLLSVQHTDEDVDRFVANVAHAGDAGERRAER